MPRIPATAPVHPADPEGAIAAAERNSNWGRWGVTGAVGGPVNPIAVK